MENRQLMFSLDQKKLALALANAEMNLSDLAKAMGVTRAATSHYLKSVSIRPATAGKLAKALGVRVEDLI